MRYSRLKRRNRRRYTSMILLGLLLFLAVYIGSASAAGNFISRIVTSFLGSFTSTNQGEDDASVQAPNTQLTVPNKTDKTPNEGSSQKVTEQLDIAPFNLYAIQLGAFTNKENAEVAAKELQAKGGAGYILNDKYFRLLAMGYASEADAQKVKQQLEKEGIESQIYSISAPGVNMEITASADKVNSVKSAFSLWIDKTKALEGIVKNLDTSAISVEDARKDIEAMVGAFNSTLEQLKAYSATQESNHILAGLQELYQNSIESLNGIFAENVVDRVATSSKIKYTYIDMVYKYKQYMDKITSE
ncbi:MAG: SPOR domain-containing protein [Caldicoprobacter oshimai]|uniref:Sporulation related domain-containing protein n=1 Tax=Caldicoprobacter faecalis TaxID=937334 RepID=A0A1I5SIN0_9FIRM|nr:SPOR domain-containing protein [Caldicoprobacter faecalis]PZN10759.1 MAG: hypothetical protein DIU64_04885 [Caldicoprobacter oshimai]SFP70634.1 Sporulation related domain-containing protein [Caldicoprobacter faecalis]